MAAPVGFEGERVAENSTNETEERNAEVGISLFRLPLFISDSRRKINNLLLGLSRVMVEVGRRCGISRYSWGRRHFCPTELTADYCFAELGMTVALVTTEKRGLAGSLVVNFHSC